MWGKTGEPHILYFRHFFHLLSPIQTYKCRLKTPLLTKVSTKHCPSSASLLPFGFWTGRWVLFVHITTVLGAGLSPSSGRWQSNQWWQTTCGPWYHWLHSWGCQSVWSGPPAASFSTDPSGLSWSGTESEPVNSNSISVYPQTQQFLPHAMFIFLKERLQDSGLQLCVLTQSCQWCCDRYGLQWHFAH